MRKRLVLFFLLGLAAFGIDRLSKWWALRNLSDNEPVRWLVGHFLGLELEFNYGASLSFAEDYTWVFTLIGVGAVIAIPFFMKESRLWNICLAFVWAGALGNLYDRLFAGPFGRGPVTDFIVYFSWFTGNIADIFLVVGVIVLMLLVVRESFLEESSARDE